ncbi:hypothetical protein P5673_020799, partial [Acropora cervicornis]
MSSPASAKTVPLEPNVLIANEVHDAVEVDDTDHVEFDLDELKEQLGIDGILEKLNDLAAKFCGGKTRTEYSGSVSRNSTSSSETAEGATEVVEVTFTTDNKAAPAETQPGLGRLDLIRKTLSNKGFSKQAVDIICASWTAGTEKQYKGVWDKWSGWCRKRQIDLPQASVTQVVEFLTDCFHEGKGYSTINTYRSALSTTLCAMNDDRDSLGSHPLIARLLKGVYILRPPTPRYSSTWDVSKRQQALSALDLNFRKESQDSITFVVSDRLKTSRPGKSIEITFSSSGCASICPLAALKEYISRSETLRFRSGHFVSKLFLSLIRPYNP